jgi:hypothetical protein
MRFALRDLRGNSISDGRAFSLWETLHVGAACLKDIRLRSALGSPRAPRHILNPKSLLLGHYPFLVLQLW